MPAQARYLIQVDKDAGDQRLDRFLRRHFPRLPHSLLQKLLRKRAIVVGSRRVTASTRLQLGDTVEVWADLSEFQPSTDSKKERLERLRNSRRFRSFFRPLHEDQSILVLDKPAGVVVHPSRGHRKGDSLLDLVQAHIPEAFESADGFRPAFAHRLDQGTSGVIVLSKTRGAANILESFFRMRQVKKRYVALVNGNVRKTRGVINMEIEKENTRSGVTRYRANRGVESKIAHTEYKVIERLPKASLLRVELVTGRTHQIRVHFSAIGHSVLGDGEYGNKGVNRKLRENLGLRRIFLHAEELTIPHPDTGTILQFSAPFPEELEKVLATLRSEEG